MNPEFQRNLWLEASPRKLAWVGLTLALIYGATAFLARDNANGPLGALAVCGGLVFLACGLIWGTRAVAASVLGEIADRTWDSQRLSALTPWQMTWGKLAGSATMAWIGGLTGLVPVALSLSRDGQYGGFWTVGFLVALAIFLHAVCMAIALIGVRKARAEGRVARANAVLGGLILGLILILVVAGSSGFQRGAGLSGLSSFLWARGDIAWANGVFRAEVFRLLAMAAFAAWAVVAAWRLMRLELQMKNGPIAWPGFLIFFAAFSGGFVAPTAGVAAALLVAALAVALCAYIAAFADPADRVRLRQFGQSLGRSDLSRAMVLMPSTLAPVLLATGLVIAALLLGTPHRFGSGPDGPQAAALMAFVLRDLGVVTLFRFGPRSQRGDFGAVVALALLYIVGGVIGRAMGFGEGAAFFAPLSDAPWISLVSGLVQAAIAWTLAVRRIRAPEKAR